MTVEEFAAWLRELVDEGQISRSQATDLALQRAAFEEARTGLEAEFDQRVVGFQRRQLLVADSVGGLMALAAERGDGGLIYFEGIGHDPFGGE